MNFKIPPDAKLPYTLPDGSILLKRSGRGTFYQLGPNQLMFGGKCGAMLPLSRPPFARKPEPKNQQPGDQPHEA